MDCYKCKTNRYINNDGTKCLGCGRSTSPIAQCKACSAPLAEKDMTISKWAKWFVCWSCSTKSELGDTPAFTGWIAQQDRRAANRVAGKERGLIDEDN